MTTIRFSALVGNVGTVLETDSYRDARLCARTYVDMSKAGGGRCAGESVYIFENDELVASYEPPENPDTEIA